MRRILHRVLSLCLTLSLCAGLLALPATASGSSAESTDRADKLASLHLFQGTEQGYQLNASPSRIQGLVMLIRLLGMEDEALACTEDVPFTDIGWGKAYVAYGYANGLAKGTSETTFAPNSALNAQGYVTFLLRALGYTDAEGGDFTWKTALEFAAEKSLISSDSVSALAAAVFNRGDMVDLSYAALTCQMKDGGKTLAESLSEAGVFTEDEGRAAGVVGGKGYTYQYTPYNTAGSDHTGSTTTPAVSSAVTHSKFSAAGVTANVLTVDMDKAIVKTALVNNTVGDTASFKSIVEQSGAVAVVNGNFFNSYDAFQCPIGHVMVDGEFLYGNSGISSFGITRDGEIRVGRPALFTRLTRSDGKGWSIYEINTAAQNQYTCTMYTPAYNSARTLTITAAARVMTVESGVITGYRTVSAGETLSIPAKGYLVYMSDSFTSTNYFATPEVGDTVTMSYTLNKEDPEGFTLDNMESIVSGAPRLVQDGAMITALDAGFEEARFTTMSSPRTAVGVNREGRLLLVSVPSATVQQMRELMLALGCVDAINLDGGGSCAMYYNGSYLATPGRNLTVTLQVFEK